MDTNPISLDEQSGKPPEKYIRTFASDMDTFQKGGVPGLAPLKRSSPVVSQKVEESVDTPSKDEDPSLLPVSIQDTEPEPLPPLVVEVPETELVLDEPEAEPVFRPEPEPELELELDQPSIPVVEEKPIPLQTYAEDFRQRMKEAEASTMTILAAEQDAAPRPIATVGEETGNSYTFLVVLASIFLLGVGAIGIYFAYTHYKIALAPVFIAPTVSAPIFVDSSEKISGSGSVLMQAIKQSIDTPLPANNIRLLSLEASSPTSVFSALLASAPVPNILLRNIHAAGSIAGVVNTGSDQSVFFILSVSAYDATFSGMLSWEPTMRSDFGELFPLYTTQNIATSSLKTPALKTPATRSGVKESFRDEVVSNHDVRIYRDAQGKSILVYGYWNQTLLVIARDPIAFALILGRLATSHS